MHSTFNIGQYADALILLGVAGFLVPVLSRLKINPILGYIGIGVFLGPHGLGALASAAPWLSAITFDNPEELTRLADLGVVFLLFIIGLELNYHRLVTLRRLVFGLGGAQIVISAVIIGALALWFGNAPRVAVIVGMSLAVSSTAIVIDLLSRERRLASFAGRASFAMLLMQDIAVVAMLLLVTGLSQQTEGNIALDIVLALGQATLVVAVIVVAGHLALRPFFRLIAARTDQAHFVAGTLLVVMVTALAAAMAGLSMALGAFIAGILLAGTEFRRSTESAIEPFKGILLGVFFFSVGVSVDLGQFANNPLWIAASIVGLVAIKAAIIVPLALWFKLPLPAAIESALLLGAGGEFAFVIIGTAQSGNIIPTDVAGFMLLVTAGTMTLIPFLAMLARAIASKFESDPSLAYGLPAGSPISDNYAALVVGYGRVGTLVSEMLDLHGISHVIVDQNTLAVERGRKSEKRIYYGNVADVGFLRACGIERVKTLILTIDNHEAIDKIVEVVRTLRSDLPIIARARDAQHAAALYAEGVTTAVPETIEASLQLAEASLVANGVAMGPVIAAVHERRDQFRQELKRGH